MTTINLKIITDEDFIGFVDNPYGLKEILSLAYKDGGYSWLPENFMVNNWRNHCNEPGTLYIGKCSGFGAGSFIRFSNENEVVRVGRYVSGGVEIMFMSSGFHETKGISTCEFCSYASDLKSLAQIDHGPIVVKNDVWFGDSCMIMAGSTVENGCVIGARSILPPKFKSEPYGIYAGSPARLKKFRFSEKVIELLLDIAWWDMPLLWIKENNNYFLMDMTSDGAVDVLQELKEKKEKWISDQNTSAA